MTALLGFLRDRRGVVAATAAVLMPALILFMALAVEVGEWYTIDRQLQSVADAAAVSAALELANGGTLATALTKAGYAASADGFSGAPALACLTAINPDATGACAASTTTGYVKANVSLSQPTVFASFFSRSVAIGANAVASWTQPYRTCGLGLGVGPIGPNVVTAVNAPNITLGTGCVLASDSTDANSMNVAAANIATSGPVTGQTLISAGGLTGSCTGCAPPVVDGPVIPDPMSCLLPANAAFCAAVSTIPGGCNAMPAVPVPGSCYTSMIFNSAIPTTIPAGTYYTTGNFDVQSGTVTGNGVTIVLTNASTCEGNATIEGNTTTATLTAPSSGTFAGMLFIQVAQPGVAGAPCSSVDSIGAGTPTTTPTATLAGTIYSPDATWTFDASPSTTCLNGASPCIGCLTVTANVLVFAGAGTMDLEGAGCTTPAGTNPFNVASVSLVE